MTKAHAIIKRSLNEIKDDRLLVFGKMTDYLSFSNIEACKLMEYHGLINIVNKDLTFPLTSATISQKGIDVLKKHPNIESYFKEIEEQELLKESRLKMLDELNITNAKEAIKNYKSTRIYSIIGTITGLFLVILKLIEVFVQKN